MATRSLTFLIEDGGYATDDVGAWVAFYPSSGTNAAFGGDTPTTMSFDFPRSTVYANHKDPVNITWDLKLLVGGNWYNLFSGSGLMSKTSSDFSVSNAPVPSALQNALKSHPISEIGLFQTSSSRSIRGEAGTTASCTITYTQATNCVAPTTISLSGTGVAPGAKVQLSWSGATAGTNNAITGYQVYRATSSGGNYSLLSTVSSTASSGSTTVTAPTTDGASYYYKVVTLGSVSGLHSGMSDESTPLTCSFASVNAPTTVKLASTNASPGAGVLLSWSGAADGTNNAIKGYQVYRADASGEYTALDSATVTTSATEGSVTVYAPTANMESYHYKVMTLGTQSGSDSALSTAFATLTCNFATPSAPSRVRVNGASSAYAKPSTAVTLEWSDAADGVNNPVTGYEVYRNGSLFKSGLSASTNSLSVTSHVTAGNTYEYTVVAVGAYANSAHSAKVTVYSYTDPKAPTSVSVQDANPHAGSRVLLSWSGAEAGGFNNIEGYIVYRATAANGQYARVYALDGTETSGSCYVTAPSTTGEKYYFRVETAGSYSTSGQSSVYATITAGEAAPDDDGYEVIITPKPPRKKRGFVFGEYDTAAHGWTLTGWEFPEPETQTNYVEVIGRMAGPIDLSTYLTDGDPRYNGRSLTATFEHSDGTRLERNKIISEMVNLLHGYREEIVLPDDDTRYAVGRLAVMTEYSDPAHAAITVEATCEPWRYNKSETRLSLEATETEQVAWLHNDGRRVLIPEIKVTGYRASVTLGCSGKTWTLGAGTYKLPEMRLRHGNTWLTYSGVGTVDITYREAVL